MPQPIPKGFHDAQAFVGLGFFLLAGFRVGVVAQLCCQVIQVERTQQVVDGFGAHFGDKFIGVRIVEQLVVFGQRVEDFEVFLFGQQIHFADAFLAFDTRVDDHVALVIHDGFQFFGRHAEDITDFIRQTFEKPDMHHRYDEPDMAHTFAAYFFLRHLHPAAVANDAFVADTLVFAAVAFVILYRTENAFAEQAVALGLVRAVVDGLRLEHLAVAALQDFIRAG